MPKKIIPIILASLFGLLIIVIVRDGLGQSRSNPTLASIEIEVSDAVNVSFTSAYWRIAKFQRYHTDRDLETALWLRADETLSYMSEPNEDVAELRRILAYEREHPDNISNWSDRKRNGHWYSPAAYHHRIGSLKKTYYGSSRRTCRVVAAIILERAVVALQQLETAPTSEAYWTLRASELAVHDALHACPEPMSAWNSLLSDVFRTSLEIGRAVHAHSDAFLPPERELPEGEIGTLLDGLSGFTITTGDEGPIITSAELLATSQRITEQSIKVWKSGPDNLILRTWNGARRFLEYWPD